MHDELNLDGNPALNLASFVTSWMEPQADVLAVETLAKNLIDEDEYPQTAVAHERSLSGRTGVYDIEVTNQRGETIALFRGKSYRIKGHIVEDL